MTKYAALCLALLVAALALGGCGKKTGEELVYRIDPSAGVKTAQVTGTVKDVSRLPAKGSTPYWDCITAIWLTDADSSNEEVKNAKDGILVYVVSLDDGEETDNASIVPGDRVTMEIVPWKSAEGKYGTYQRIELDDPDSYVLDAWFRNDKIKKGEEEDD